MYRQLLVVLVAAAVGALAAVMALHTSGKPHVAQQPNVPAAHATHYGTTNLGIPYGATATAVLRALGTPTAKSADCWLYRGRVGTIRGRYAGDYVDAMRFCFADGPLGSRVVTRIFNHVPKHTIVMPDPETGVVTRRTYGAKWGPPITVIRPPDWYFQQNA